MTGAYTYSLDPGADEWKREPPPVSDPIRNYQDAYKAFFGIEAPPVRKLESGGFSVRFADGSKRYSKLHLAAVTGMMNRLKGNADA